MTTGSTRPHRRWWRDDSGMVTAEAALVLPALVLLVWAALGAVAVATAQLRCVDAAREGARAAARGDSVAASEATARRVAPHAAAVSVSLTAGNAVVDVATEVEPLGGLLPAVRVRGHAVAAREPGRPR